MNNVEDSNELLDWDKKNIVRFAQFLYDLAKEQVQAEKAISTDESIVEPIIEPEIQIEDTASEVEIKEEILEEPEVEIKEEILEEPEVEIKEEILEEPEVEIKEEILEEPEVEEEIRQIDEQTHLESELQKVTIGLAKAVSGEDIGEIDVSEKEEIQEIIEKEQIPLPSEGKEGLVEAHFDEVSVAPEAIVEIEETITQELPEEDIQSLESVDLSSPIVKEPVINEQILIQPENIPKDIHNLIFVEETTSVPITKDEIIISTIEESEQDIVEVTPEIIGEPMVEKVDLEQIIQDTVIDEIVSEPEVSLEPEVFPEPEVSLEPEVFPEPEVSLEPEVFPEPEVSLEPEVFPEPEVSLEPEVFPEPEVSLEPEVFPEPEVSLGPEIIPEPEVVIEERVEGLDSEAVQRRQSIIEQMLADTKKREEQEGFKVRELGETEGKSYSAVVFGNESTKNVKKWKKWERRRLRQEKKKKK